MDNEEFSILDLLFYDVVQVKSGDQWLDYGTIKNHQDKYLAINLVKSDLSKYRIVGGIDRSPEDRGKVLFPQPQD